jgi:hypothetical protein
MFMPIASPVVKKHWAKTRRPNTCGRISVRRPCAVVSAAIAASSATCSRSHRASASAERVSATTKHGAMSSPSPTTYAFAPPASLIARIPYWYVVTSVPSVVANGT